MYTAILISCILHYQITTMTQEIITLANELSKKTFTAGKENIFFDFSGNEIDMPRKDIINAVEDGNMNAIHVNYTPEGVLRVIRVSDNNEMVRITEL